MLAIVASGCSGNCPPAAASGAATADSAELSDTELIGKAEKLAGEICECPSAMCADAGAASFVELVRGRGDELRGETAERLLAATEKVLGCRVRLAYPSDPVDMDGAAGDPGGASPASAGGDSD